MYLALAIILVGVVSAAAAIVYSVEQLAYGQGNMTGSNVTTSDGNMTAGNDTTGSVSHRLIGKVIDKET